MSRVLIWNRVRPGSELDIFHSTDYANLYDHIVTSWNGACQNWGNRLWFQGIYSALDTGENTYEFLPDTIDYERINREYDFIILSMANVFNPEYAGGMRNYEEVFSHIRIPVYVIACGVQADSYDALDDVIHAVGEDASRFIRSVYQTGGEFALRGYFTKEFFDKLGFHSAVVTGCPSLYQMGPDFCVRTDPEKKDKLRPVFNGRVKKYAELMEAFPESVFIDQDECLAPLFDPQYLANPDFRFRLNFMSKYGIRTARYLSENRIRMFADMNEWRDYLQNNSFNYAFGSRIHGTIMSLLSGIPATIVAGDSRTREMAEFFDIPTCTVPEKHRLTEQDVREQYLRIDYSRFNQNFAARFQNYEKFLTDRGIVSHVNCDNRFFTGESPKTAAASGFNQSEFSDFADSLQRNERILQMALSLRKIRERMPL